MGMNNGRRVGLLCTVVVSCVLILILLLFVSVWVMLSALALLLLAIALIWRFRPELLGTLLPAGRGGKESGDFKYEGGQEVFISDLVLVSTNSANEQIIRVNKKRMIFGTASGCDVVMPADSGISRIHAMLFYSEKDDHFHVADQGSTYGTFLNGVRLEKGTAQVLCKGDKLRLNHMEYLVRSAYYK